MMSDEDREACEKLKAYMKTKEYWLFKGIEECQNEKELDKFKSDHFGELNNDMYAVIDNMYREFEYVEAWGIPMIKSKYGMN